MINDPAKADPEAVDPPQSSQVTKLPNRPTYTIYLLTVWHDSPDHTENASDPAGWRFRLENPRTKAAKGYVGLTMLVQGLTETIRQEKADVVQTQDHHESAEE